MHLMPSYDTLSTISCLVFFISFYDLKYCIMCLASHLLICISSWGHFRRHAIFHAAFGRKEVFLLDFM